MLAIEDAASAPLFGLSNGETTAIARALDRYELERRVDGVILATPRAATRRQAAVACKLRTAIVDRDFPGLEAYRVRIDHSGREPRGETCWPGPPEYRMHLGAATFAGSKARTLAGEGAVTGRHRARAEWLQEGDSRALGHALARELLKAR